MFERDLSAVLKRYASKFPVVAILGPRQSGKTTLVKAAFPHYSYRLLEEPDTLAAAQEDPRRFLKLDRDDGGIILDEFQNAPALLSYIQGIVDQSGKPGQYILTGSQNFLMNQSIGQSLAGRVGILTLLPLSIGEMDRNNLLGTGESENVIFTGTYPRIFADDFEPKEFYASYIKTYAERDVRQLVNVVNLSTFQRFMRLCAGRIGQILNISSLADGCGISSATVNSWLSILEASYIIFLLQPHFENFNKQLIKSPKLYFFDTGLASFLLKIASPEQLDEHYLRGGLFENLIISEFYKLFYNSGQEPPLYFWRDNHGHEIDCVLDYGQTLIPIEIKAAQTVNTSHFDDLKFWAKMTNTQTEDGFVVYAGPQSRADLWRNVISWTHVGDILKKIPH